MLVFHSSTELCYFLIGLFHIHHIFHMACTKIIARLSDQPSMSERLSEKSSQANSSSSYKKRLSIRMNVLAIQPISHPTTWDVNMRNDQVGPVVVRDFPAGSLMLLLLEERARLSTDQRRPQHRCGLVTNEEEEADNDGSQGDRPLHASVSMPSSYHDVSNDLLQMSIPRNTTSKSNDVIQVVNAILPESDSLPNQMQYPSRSAPHAPLIAQER